MSKGNRELVQNYWMDQASLEQVSRVLDPVVAQASKEAVAQPTGLFYFKQRISTLRGAQKSDDATVQKVLGWLESEHELKRKDRNVVQRFLSGQSLAIKRCPSSRNCRCHKVTADKT